MAVPEQPSYTAHVGNGIATTFTFEFLCVDEGDLAIMVGGATVDASLYTVAGIGEISGGSVAFSAAPASGAPIVIAQDVKLRRDTDYQTNGDLFAKTINRDFDRIWLALQRSAGNMFGAIRAPYPEQLTPLPSAPDRANHILGFGVDGNPVILDYTISTMPSPVLESIAALRLVAKSATAKAFVMGYYVSGDGGGGAYWYDSADTSSADNGGTIIVAADGGRWKRVLRGPATVKDFGAYGDGTHDDTDAFVRLAAWYQLGNPISIPDTGSAYLVQPDQIVFTPPVADNNLYQRPPTIRMDKEARIRAYSAGMSGQFLVQIGTPASDYSGYLRSPTFELGIFDAYGGNFAQGVVWFPFFIDLNVDVQVMNHLGIGIKYGSTSAPAASAGIKGRRHFDRNLYLYRLDTTSITNAANPVVTLDVPATWPTAPWPTSGNVCVCLIGSGTPTAWNPILNTTLDATITSAGVLQLLNVNTTSYGALTGSVQVYLCLPSMRVSKKISGITNANPCVITTAVPHLLTTGDIVDVAEALSMGNVYGQYTATVLSATTFSIPIDTTNTATWGTYNADNGPGLVMPWVPIEDCDIAEYRENATDADDSECYIRHVRVGIYNDPATSGWDGKGSASHFYSFPQTAELLTAYYVGGDNDFSQVQVDGPFRYAFWATGPRNASALCSTNTGYIDPRDIYGCLVRLNAGASWHSTRDRLKSNSGSYRAFTDAIGPGYFECSDNLYSSVYSPAIEVGRGRRAAAIVFDGTDLSVKTSFQIPASGAVARTPGGDARGDYFVNFVRPVPLTAYLELGLVNDPGVILTEDFGWANRSTFQRRLRACNTSGTAIDVHLVSATWRYDNINTVGS